ncbi:unnamed protein product, partial [Amoebophrya sp. A25]|eukprot:GSA25T00001146001.1
MENSPTALLLNMRDDVFVSNYTNMALKRPESKEQTDEEPMMIRTLFDREITAARSRGPAAIRVVNRSVQCGIISVDYTDQLEERLRAEMSQNVKKKTCTVGTQAFFAAPAPPPPVATKDVSTLVEDRWFFEDSMGVQTDTVQMKNEITQTTKAHVWDVGCQTTAPTEQGLEKKYDDLFEKFK